MQEITLTLVRSCNDRVLYGSVTQRDICDALQSNGYDVGTRSCLAAAIRRIGEYLSPSSSTTLRTEIVVIVEPDPPRRTRGNGIDDEGNLIMKEPKAETMKPRLMTPPNPPKPPKPRRKRPPKPELLPNQK